MDKGYALIAAARQFNEWATEELDGGYIRDEVDRMAAR